MPHMAWAMTNAKLLNALCDAFRLVLCTGCARFLVGVWLMLGSTLGHVLLYIAVVAPLAQSRTMSSLLALCCRVFLWVFDGIQLATATVLQAGTYELGACLTECF